MKAILKIQAKFKPVSGDLQGYRILAALPNMAARRMLKTSKGFRATNEAVPSFSGAWLIAESMDYASQQLVKKADLERFKQRLLWQGFTEFQMITKEEKAVDPKVQAQIDAMLARLGFSR